jgi:hypothetical protein
MTDKEYESAKTEINRILFPLKDLLLNDWNLKYIYHRNYHEDNRETMAMVNALWEYKSATMQIYVPSINDNCPEPSELCRVLLHEFVHCMIDPITPSEPANDHERAIVEFTTQTVTDNIMRMFENPDLFTKTQKKAKKAKKS